MASTHVPVPFAIPSAFNSELRKAADLLDAGAAALQRAQSVLISIGATGIDSEHKAVTYFIYAKALKTANAIQILCRTGFGSDGLALCAVLFENLVDLLYIGKAPKRRSQRYFQFENVEKLYQAQKVLRQKRLPKGRRKQYRKYEVELLAQVSHLLRYFPNRASGWAQKSIYDRAKEIKAGLGYQELYWIFCAHKHTLPMSAVAITEITTSGDTVAISGPHIKGVCDAAEQSARVLLGIIMAVDGVFGFGLRSQLANDLSNLEGTIQKVRSEYPTLFD